MASTYSTNLKIELIGTGEQSGTWGSTTNTNLGTALEQSIVGYGNPNFTSDADLTISLTDSNATQTARNLALNVTSSVSLTATRNLIVPTIQKPYIIRNNTTGSQSIVVKTSAGTGITVPNGAYTVVYTDGTNVVSQITQLPSLTLATALAATSGGTGQSSYAVGDLLYASTATALSKLADVATGNALLSGGVSTAPAWGKVGLTTHVSGTLPVANGGTGDTTYTNGQLLIGNTTGNTLTKATLTAGSGITITNGTGSITIAAPNALGGTVTSVSGTGTVNGITLSGTVTSSGSLTLGGTLSGVSLTTQVTGTLPVANGGTGVTTSTGSGAVVLSNSPTITLANATGLPLTTGVTGTLPIANGGTGSTSTTYVSLTTNVTGTLPVANGGTGVTTAAAITALVGNLLFPVGSIYTNATVATNPGTLLGFGTWSALGAGRVLIGDGDGYSAGATGGSADAVVVSHTHTATSTVSDPGHFHSNGSTVEDTANYGPGGFTRQGVTNTGTATTGITVATTNSTEGSSGTNANLQPYIVVYMWQRTA